MSCSPFRVPIARLAAAQAALGKDAGEHGVKCARMMLGSHSTFPARPMLAALLLIASVFMTSGAFSASRTRQIIRYDGVAIDVIIEGQGPAILLLPSLARDSGRSRFVVVDPERGLQTQPSHFSVDQNQYLRSGHRIASLRGISRGCRRHAENGEMI